TPTLSQQSSICGEPPPPTPDTEDTPGSGSMDLNDMYARNIYKAFTLILNHGSSNRD
ncbi:hypothetical protein TNCT_203331, partial [Trichonephila clavata]